MSDPLSVAGTAVGIASLGIQVCQGLIKYLRAVRGRKEEIREGIQEIEQVVSLLSSLNNTLPSVGPKSGTITLRTCLKNCYAKLEGLQELLAELGDSQQSHKSSTRATDVVHAVSYPFRQEKLNAIRQSLRSVLSDLDLIISIISLDSGASILETVNNISQDLKGHVTNHDSHVSDLMHSNSVQLQSLQTATSHTLNDINDQLHRTQLSIQDLDQRIYGKLTIIENGTRSIEASNQVTVAKLEEFTQALVSHSALISSMGMQINDVQSLHSEGAAATCQSMDVPTFRNNTSPAWNSSGKLRQACYCTSTLPKSTTLFKFWNMDFQFQWQEHHHPYCRLWGTRKGIKRTAKAEFRLRLAWLSTRMTYACFEYTSGTCKPGLSLRCRNVVREQDSPVYNLILSFLGGKVCYDIPNQLLRKLQSLERDILMLYSKGLASPFDTNECGETHAEMVFSSLSLPSPFSGAYSIRKALVTKILQDTTLTYTLIGLLRTLLESNDSDVKSFSFVRALASQRRSTGVFQQETDNIKHLLSFMDENSCFKFYVSLAATISEFEPSAYLKSIIKSATDLPPIAKAILSRSLEDLVICVTRAPESVLEVVFGASVLQLSIAWPEGLRHLMKTDAKTLIDKVSEPGGLFWSTPILRAIRLDRDVSVRILLEAGCYLGLRQELPSDCEVSNKVAAVIATYLCERRLRLLEVAQTQLGLSTRFNSVAFADSAAARICHALDTADVPLHPSLRVEPDYQSVYSQSLISFTSFKEFWKRGFHHIKCHDYVRLTPVVTRYKRWSNLLGNRNVQNIGEILSWLGKTGFLQETANDPLNLGLDVYATGYHYTGAIFAEYLLENPFDLTSIGSVTQFLKEHSSTVGSEDNCMCWCSSEGRGCSPRKVFLKAYLHDVLYQPQPEGRRLHVFLHHEPFDTSDSHQPSAWVKEALRLLTFEALEMAHTCCAYDQIQKHDPNDVVTWDYFDEMAIFCQDPDIILEIRSCSEEQSTAVLLENLMAEFTEQIQRLTPDPRAFERFIYTHWRRRISEFYIPDPTVVGGLRQHQAFQGLGSPPVVKTGVFPETLNLLLGEDFILQDQQHIDSGAMGYTEPCCEWCFSDTKPVESVAEGSVHQNNS